MSLTQDGTSNRERINDGTLNSLDGKLKLIRLGNVLAALPTHKHGLVPALDPYQLSTLHSLSVSDFATAATVLRAYARSGTGTPGELTVVAYGATPTAGQIAVAPNGDIVTLAADAWTALDVLYQPQKHDVVEVELPVSSSGVLTFPSYLAGKPIDLMEAEVTLGSGAGKKIVIVPAASSSAGKANLNVAKTTVVFGDTGASVNSKARVKLSVAPGTDLGALLDAASTSP